MKITPYGNYLVYDNQVVYMLLISKHISQLSYLSPEGRQISKWSLFVGKVAIFLLFSK